jgi:hypothetical protein
VISRALGKTINGVTLATCKWRWRIIWSPGFGETLQEPLISLHVSIEFRLWFRTGGDALRAIAKKSARIAVHRAGSRISRAVLAVDSLPLARTSRSCASAPHCAPGFPLARAPALRNHALLYRRYRNSAILFICFYLF